MWIALVLRRIPLEEAHVRKAFGAAYDAYAARTARLLPGIY
jgi:protein-S-isoprenylcysteine O-methyltransferase Ste14